MAGFAAEELAGFARELEAGSTDCAVAKLYARTIVLSDEAVPYFVVACRAERREAMADMLRKEAGQVPADPGHLVRGRGLSLTRVCFRPIAAL
jgi:hypothetical protein